MIRNYTSSVSAQKSVAQIEAKLVACGARNISKNYDANQKIAAMVFDLPGENGRFHAVRLPGHAERIYEVLIRQRSRFNAEALRDQAERTAWKLMYDWVDVQIALIQLNQVQALEVFLPFVWDGRRTVFEALQADGFKALPAPRE